MEAIDKMRAIVRWCDWESEYINHKFRSIADIETAYDFCQKKDAEFVSNLSNRSRAELSKKLGYNI